MQLKDSWFNQAITELFSWGFTYRSSLLVAAGSQQCSAGDSHSLWILDVSRLVLTLRFSIPAQGCSAWGLFPFPLSLGSVSSLRSSLGWD